MSVKAEPRTTTIAVTNNNAGSGGSSMTSAEGVHSWKNIALGGKRGTVSGVLKMNKDGIAWRSKGGQSVTVVGGDLLEAGWAPSLGRQHALRLLVKGGSGYTFDGFAAQDGEFLKSFLNESFGVTLQQERVAVRGWNWGAAVVRGGALRFSVNEERAFEVPLTEVAKGAVQGKGNELAVELVQDDTGQGQDALVELKLWLGRPNAEEGSVRVAAEAAQSLLDAVLAKATPSGTNPSAALVSFEDVPALVPRGRFEVELSATGLRLHGKQVHDYRIQYSSIVRLFQLPKPDQAAMLFVISLEPPIRQGHTTYPHIVMQIPEDEETTLNVQLPPGAEQDERLQKLAQIESGPTFQVLARVFKALTDKRITVPKSFKAKSGARAIKCSYKANEGYLYPLERSLFFVHKPPTYVRFEEIKETELQRVTTDATMRTFDLAVTLRGGLGQVVFKGIAREEYAPLFAFLQEKELRIVNLDALQEQGTGKGKQQTMRLPEGEEDGSSDEEDQDFDKLPSSDEDEEEDQEGEVKEEEEEGEERGVKRPRETRRTRGQRGQGQEEEEKLAALELGVDYDEPSDLGGEGSGSGSGDEEEEEEEEERPRKKAKTEEKPDKKEKKEKKEKVVKQEEEEEEQEEEDGADFDD